MQRVQLSTRSANHGPATGSRCRDRRGTQPRRGTIQRQRRRQRVPVSQWQRRVRVPAVRVAGVPSLRVGRYLTSCTALYRLYLLCRQQRPRQLARSSDPYGRALCSPSCGTYTTQAELTCSDDMVGGATATHFAKGKNWGWRTGAGPLLALPFGTRPARRTGMLQDAIQWLLARDQLLDGRVQRREHLGRGLLSMSKRKRRASRRTEPRGRAQER